MEINADYSYSSPGIVTNGLSPSKTYFSLVKSMICTGILYQPRSFYLGGVVFSSISCIIVGLLTLLCMIWLAKAQSQYKGTYPEIAGVAMGPKGKYSVDFMIFVTQTGPPAVNVGFIIDNTLQSLSDLGADTEAYIIMLVLLVILIPLCLIRTIREISITHVIADFIIIVNILIMGIYSTSLGVTSDDIPIITPKNMIYTLGTLVYGFEGIALLLPIRSEMAQPFKFDKILTFMIITVIVLFLWFSNVCAFAYGSKTKDLVSLNLPKEIWVSIMILFYVVAVILTLPLALYPAFTIVEDYCKLSGIYDKAVRIGIVCIVVVMGTLARNNLGIIVSVLGGIFCSPLAFIFPSLINLNLNAKTGKEKNHSKIMLIIGVLFGISAAFSTIYSVLV